MWGWDTYRNSDAHLSNRETVISARYCHSRCVFSRNAGRDLVGWLRPKVSFTAKMWRRDSLHADVEAFRFWYAACDTRVCGHGMGIFSECPPVGSSGASSAVACR